MSTQVPQRDETWLKAASPAEMGRAYAAGELAELIGLPVPLQVAPGEQFTGEQLAKMTPDEITKAFNGGACDELLGRNGSTAA